MGDFKAYDKESITAVYKLLKEDGKITFDDSDEASLALLKLAGFNQISSGEALKKVWGSGGSLKARRAKQEETKGNAFKVAEPVDVEMINEDELLDDEDEKDE